MAAGRRVGVLCTAIACVAAGCGGSGSPSPDFKTLQDLGGAQAADVPYFFVGESFGGLPLTYVDYGPAGGSFIYGTCEADVWSDEPSCAPPLEVQNKVCPSGRVLIAVYSYEHADAIEHLRPVNSAARGVRPARVSLGEMPSCAWFR